MARKLINGVTDEAAVEAAFILKSYAHEHTFSDSIFPVIDQKSFYKMKVPSPYRISDGEKKLLEGFAAIGAIKIRSDKYGALSWVKIEDHREVVGEMPTGVLDVLRKDVKEYDIYELISGELQIDIDDKKE